MSNSMISIIFLGVLGALFVLLVILTIVLLFTRKKDDEDDGEYYDNEETDDEYVEDEDIYDSDGEEISDEEISDEEISDEDISDEESEDEEYEESEDEELGDEESDDGDSQEEEAIAEDSKADEPIDDEAYDEDSSEEKYEEEDEVNEEEAEESDEAVTEVLKAKEEISDEDENLGYLEETDISKAEEEAEAQNTGFLEDELGDYSDSAFAPYQEDDSLSNEALIASVKEAEAMSEAVIYGKNNNYTEAMFGIRDELDKYGNKKPVKKSVVSSDEDFYWYNKLDVAEKPSYKTKEMYYHYFNIPKDCIDDLLVEMYDCALVRTEEIRYIAYGIEPKAVSLKDILSEGNYYYSEQPKKKEPLPQDLIRIYEKWCGYVDKLFDKVEIHADEYTIQEIRSLLCEYGRNDVDVLIEGK